MSGPLLSDNWYRVESLHPHLRPHVQVQRQRFRDQIWYQLVDTGSGRRHRLNEAAYRFIGHMDGKYTVDQVWKILVQTYGDDALTQDEAIRVLGQLSNVELLQCELSPDIDALFRQYKEQVRRKRKMELNPLAIRVRLFDPSRQLALFDAWLPRIFQPAMFVFWLIVVLPAILLAGENWVELTTFAASHADSPRYLWIAWLAYPLIKAVHELGHALAVRRWGGQVHDVGFTAFVLVPVPYVDASDATGFTHRYQRAMVSGIGIMVELFMASLALYIWLNVQPGWVQDTSFIVMLIAGISTVVFNGNPLLRFDGYHLFCDLLELPNLDARSKTWWNNLLRRRLFKQPIPATPLAAGEMKWLALYAPLAWFYRIYVGIVIAFWAAAKSVILGLIVIVSVVAMLIFKPVLNLLQEMLTVMQNRGRQGLKIALGASVIAVIAGITFIPMPYGAVTQAVVSLPDKAQVRAETDGMVLEIKVKDGETVVLGQVIAILEAPELIANQASAQSRLVALRIQQYKAMESDRLQTIKLTNALSLAEAEVTRLNAQVSQLEVRSQIAGTLVMSKQNDLIGTFLKKGQLLSYVLGPGELIVRAAVSNNNAPTIRELARSAEIRLEEQPVQTITGQLRRDVPAATFQLPNAALANRNGGDIITDPSDPENLRTLEPVFWFDVALPSSLVQRVGGRAWVRFDFGKEPLASQWAHSLNQLFMQHSSGAG